MYKKFYSKMNCDFCGRKDTMKSPPPKNQTIKKASMGAVLITTFFYLCCGCFGYAAFGNNTQGNLLTEFGFNEPFWLVTFANACIVLHLIGGYQGLLQFQINSSNMSILFGHVISTKILNNMKIFASIDIYSASVCICKKMVQ